MVDLDGGSIFDSLGGLRAFPSAFGGRTGDDIGLSFRCLLDGIPRADARLLAMEELTSRECICAGSGLCCWEI